MGGPGIRSHVTNFIHMNGGQRVKMNMGKQKVSEVQGAAVHKASKLSSDSCTIVLDSRQ